MRFRLLEQFLELESASSIVLFISAIIAIVWANSPLNYIHLKFIDAFLFWINEGLMTIFFLLVGLELKNGYIRDKNFKLSVIILPLAAALGGMLIPALIYLYINYNDAVTIKGWATPVATDIAFALGALSLFGKRVSLSLKLFLLTLAIFDDIGAIIIIAFFYSHDLSYLFLLQSALLLFILFCLNRTSVNSLIPYLLLGVVLWQSLLKSGVHPTIAGFLLALTIPNGNQEKSPAERLENFLNPWVAFCIMPLFALANAGFSFAGVTLDIITNVLVLGIILGLFIGKQVGVFGFSWIIIRLGFAKLPKQISWTELYGVSLLCGIGFTMSLFLGTLSFQNEGSYLAEVRLGVIVGSILSGLAGLLVLLIVFGRNRSRHH